MAVQVEKLLVTLEAKIDGYNRGLLQAQTQTARQLTAMETRFAQWSGNLKNSAASAGSGIGAALGGIGAYLGTQAVIDYANEWTRLTRSIEGSSQVFGIALQSAESLTRMANESRVDVEAFSKVYIRAASSIRDFGYNSETAAKLTTTLSQALKLGGASATEQRSVLEQFSQALQKGKLDGDEFRSVMENAGVVQELLAERLKVSRSELIKLAQDGKLKLVDLVEAMTGGSEKINKIFQLMPVTIDEAFVVLRNNVVQYLGTLDRATGSSQALGSATIALSKNLDAVAIVVGGILASSSLRLTAFAAATIASLNPVTLLAAAIGALATGYVVMGDKISLTEDGTISLKSAVTAFAEVVGGDAMEAVDRYVASLSGIPYAADNSIFSLNGLGNRAENLASTLDNAVTSLDNYLGLSKTVASFLVDNTNSTKLLTSATEELNRVRERAAQITFNKGAVTAGGDTYGPTLDPKKKSQPAKIEKDGFTRAIADIKKRTAEIEAENAAIDRTTFAMDKAKAAADLMFAAQQAAAKTGTKVTQAQKDAIDKLSTAYAQAQAQAQLLAKIQSVRNSNEDLQRDINLVGLYGFELDKARITQELLTEAKRAGVVSDAQRAEIDIIATQNAKLKQQLNIINEIRTDSQEALKGFISDLRQGKSATEALGNALNKIADKLIDMAVNGLVEGALGSLVKGGGSSGGGLLSSLFSGSASSLPKFANGGVSRGPAIFGEAGAEAAVPLPDGRRIPVDLRAPSAAKASSSQAVSVVVAPVFNVQNGTADGIEKLKGEIAKSLPSMVTKAMHQAFDRNARFARSGL